MANAKAPINPTYSVIGGEDTKDASTQRERWGSYPTMGYVGAFPLQLDIENTSACNLRCPQCFQSDPETRPIYTSMPKKMFEYIIDESVRERQAALERGESHGGLDSIKMQYRGEPLLTRDIHERVRYAREHHISEVMFNSNGYLLTEERSRELIDAGLSRIILSIDSHVPEVYNQYRRFKEDKEGDFQQTLKNVQDLVRLKKELGVEHPIVRVSAVEIPELDLEEYTQFWLSQGVDLVSSVALNDYSMGKEDVVVSNEFACEQPWQRLFVLSDGVITTCCGDLYQERPLGQLVLPETMGNYKDRLATQAELDKKSPGEEVELRIIHHENRQTGKVHLSKSLVGLVKENSVQPMHMRIQGITGKVHEVPLTDNIKDVWHSQLMEEMRTAQTNGESHEIDICGGCGLRKTAIGLHCSDGRTEKRESEGRAHTMRFMEKGLDMYGKEE
tara:strand:+ start:935 stop:2272 length:1338 start_codon:yes stop_codon:yes gene_type:complete